MDETQNQRQYYGATASRYDEMHGNDPEHNFALSFLASTIDHLSAKSVLDVGAGTGRVSTYLQRSRPNAQIVGIEPVAELRAIGQAKGADLIEGDAQSLPFDDKSFDVVCAFGVMHHLPEPNKAAAEMVRVARRAVFISDHNDYGRGTFLTATLKQIARGSGLWGLYRRIITRGKGYRVTDDDGIWYPYSIFDTHQAIRHHCSDVHFLNTLNSGPNLYRRASHVAMLGLLAAS